ncbi:MAG TPA: NAD(P)-binding domain-containing protein, partial [Oceanipulchritudo sp.]|nr:NAD(P)-binding domain-containing protein [Oceanipulchritudo sp.]
MSKARIGFIGLGVMGRSMAGHLLEAGYGLTVYNRTRAKAEELLAKGARWADTPQAVAEQSDIIITIVGYPHDVEGVYLGEAGILEGARLGSLTIDM